MLADVIAGKRKISPERVALLRLMMAYAYGTPDKMKPEESGRRSLNFISQRGLPCVSRSGRGHVANWMA
jgi:hypothetical protein